MYFTRKMIYFDTFTKIVGDLGKLIGVKGFKKLAKVQKNAQSGHTAHWQALPPLAHQSLSDRLTSLTFYLENEIR